jgi:hypothetical protein
MEALDVGQDLVGVGEERLGHFDDKPGRGEPGLGQDGLDPGGVVGQLARAHTVRATWDRQARPEPGSTPQKLHKLRHEARAFTQNQKCDGQISAQAVGTPAKLLP